MRRSLTLSLILAFTAACQQAPATAGEVDVLAPAAARQAKEAPGLKTAVFAGGCFWGVEGVFSHVLGVKGVLTGYHGGSAKTATYDRVGEGDTGHAEAVQVTYDPAVVRYDQLVRIFFSVAADPTLKDRQGPDVGPQYRAALVPVSEEQRQVASAYLAQMQASGVWQRPVVTPIEGYKKFYPAETYHQDFMAKNPRHPYILAWDAAKVAALKNRFPGFFKPDFTKG
ncbi:MAG: peptide-methionine (S)-S-oxide reductase MsrA [Pseudomonadota bacterium]